MIESFMAKIFWDTIDINNIVSIKFIVCELLQVSRTVRQSEL